MHTSKLYNTCKLISSSVCAQKWNTVVFQNFYNTSFSKSYKCKIFLLQNHVRNFSLFAKLEERFFRNIEIKKKEHIAVISKFGRAVQCLDRSSQFGSISSGFDDWLSQKFSEIQISESHKIQDFLGDAEAWLSARCALEQAEFFLDTPASSTGTAPGPEQEEGTMVPGHLTVLSTPGQEQSTVTQLVVRHRLCLCYIGILKNEAKYLPESLGVEDYIGALRLCLNGSMEERLKGQLLLYNKLGTKSLDEDAVSQAMNCLLSANQLALNQLFAALKELPKKQKKAFRKLVEGYILDKLQVPMRMRCVFAWAKLPNDNSGLVTFEEYLKACEEFFPEYKKMTMLIMEDVEAETKEVYEKKKNRKLAILNGFLFVLGTGIADSLVQSL